MDSTNGNGNETMKKEWKLNICKFVAFKLSEQSVISVFLVGGWKKITTHVCKRSGTPNGFRRYVFGQVMAESRIYNDKPYLLTDKSRLK